MGSEIASAGGEQDGSGDISGIASRATWQLVSPELMESVRDSVAALQRVAHRALVPSTPDALYMQAVQNAIRAVERKGDILRSLLLPGPYEGLDDIPADRAGTCLSDAECNKAIAMLYSHTVNCFKGELAEILSLGACSTLLSRLQECGQLTKDCALFIGDVARSRNRRSTAKAADLHLLCGVLPHVCVAGVVEVKSFVTTPERLDRQLSAHVRRANEGLRIVNSDGAPVDVVPDSSRGDPIQISVSVADWPLPRGYRFEEADGRSFLRVDPLPAIPPDVITQVGGDRWHIELGWSQEALSAEAYGLTYWYVEQLGADLFAKGSPWPEMTPEEAGVNAATQSLYFAIRRCTTRRAEQRAIALYNAYGFGYALGTSYTDSEGRRHMLWVEDLRELLLGMRARGAPTLRL